MKKKKIFIYGILTCKRRKLDEQKISNYFIKNNYEIVSNPQDADLIILNTCAYSSKHAEASIERIKKYQEYDSELIVGGCLPAIEEKKLNEIFNGKTLITKDLNRIDDLFKINNIKYNEINDANNPRENSNEYRVIAPLKQILSKSKFINNIISSSVTYILNNLMNEEISYYHQNLIKYPYIKKIIGKFGINHTYHKNSFFIRPSWGCLGNCTYCAIKSAIGSLKSKPLDSIIDEFRKGLNLGYKNFIFEADDLGAYGVDKGSNYIEMLDKITDIPGSYMVHLRYIHPRWIVKYADLFGKVLKKEKIQSISCSIQSGSPRILKLMHRYPDVGKIKESISKLKKVHPNLFLTTECINGFPSESAEDFQKTLNFIREINFDLGFIFPFSCRPGTEAERLKCKLSDKTILDRMVYAKKNLRENGYNCSNYKNHHILVFSKISPREQLDEGLRSFCFSI